MLEGLLYKARIARRAPPMSAGAAVATGARPEEEDEEAGLGVSVGCFGMVSRQLT